MNRDDQQLQEYLDDRLAPDARERFERRLHDDPELSERLVAYRALGDALRRGSDDAASLDDAFYERARRRFARGSSGEPGRLRPLSWEAAGLAAAAVLAGTLFVPPLMTGRLAPQPTADATDRRHDASRSVSEEQFVPNESSSAVTGQAAPLDPPPSVERRASVPAAPHGEKPTVERDEATDAASLDDRFAPAPAVDAKIEASRDAKNEASGKARIEAGGEADGSRSGTTRDLGSIQPGTFDEDAGDPPARRPERLAAPDASNRQQRAKKSDEQRRVALGSLAETEIDTFAAPGGRPPRVVAPDASLARGSLRTLDGAAWRTVRGRRDDDQTDSPAGMRVVLVGGVASPAACDAMTVAIAGDTWLIGVELVPPGETGLTCAVHLPDDGRSVALDD